MFEVSPVRVAAIIARMAKDAAVRHIRSAAASVISRVLEDVEMREMVMLRSYWRSVEKLHREYPEIAARVIAPGVTFYPEEPVDEYEIN